MESQSENQQGLQLKLNYGKFSFVTFMESMDVLRDVFSISLKKTKYLQQPLGIFSEVSEDALKVNLIICTSLMQVLPWEQAAAALSALYPSLW